MMMIKMYIVNNNNNDDTYYKNKLKSFWVIFFLLYSCKNMCFNIVILFIILSTLHPLSINPYKLLLLLLFGILNSFYTRFNFCMYIFSLIYFSLLTIDFFLHYC